VTEPILSKDDQDCLLELARQSITRAATGERILPPQPDRFPVQVQRPGATFVTLTTSDGSLRGCVGALEAYQSLAEDVWEHAEAAACHDYRFPPIRPEELPGLHIEISYLTPPVPLDYTGADDLLAKLRPGVDGVILRDGFHRATFLPQVWEKLPEPAMFLDQLCLKMGAPETLWRRKHLQVFIYQVECFEEGETASKEE
jgi:AmmeMemoRadiSam system protein A